jgi:hypothetical protein
MMAEKLTEEYKGYIVASKPCGIAKFGVTVRSPKGRLIYEAPAEFGYPNNAVHHGLRWLKSTWLKETVSDGGSEE